jgi:hypothetical protein
VVAPAAAALEHGHDYAAYAAFGTVVAVLVLLL